MKRAAGIFVLVLVASVLDASDVLGGAALTPAGKTTTPALTAEIVIDVSGGSFAPGKGQASIRVEKGKNSAAALFNSSYVSSFSGQCVPAGFTLETATNNRFIGLMNGWVDTPGVLDSLLTPLLDQLGKDKDPQKAAITDIDDISCTTVTGTDPATGVPFTRLILSFTAVIKFAKQ